MSDPTADLLLGRALGLPPRLGGTRLVCVDGPAGAGKSTLASRLAGAARRTGTAARLLHTDDLYEGWTGLPGLAERLAHEVLGPLAAGRPGSYRRWDWHAGAWAEEHVVLPTTLLVVEGVGSGTPLLDDWRSTLVWVSAPGEVRARRALRRDGGAFAPHWEAWAAQEARVFARDRTAARSDVVVDGTGRRPPELR